MVRLLLAAALLLAACGESVEQTAGGDAPASVSTSENEPPQTTGEAQLERLVTMQGTVRFEYIDGREGFFSPTEGLYLRQPLSEFLSDDERSFYGPELDDLYEKMLVPGDGTLLLLPANVVAFGIEAWEEHSTTDPQLAQLVLLLDALRLVDEGLTEAQLIPPDAATAPTQSPPGIDVLLFDVSDLSPSMASVRSLRVEVNSDGQPLSLSVDQPGGRGFWITNIEPADIDFPTAVASYEVSPPPIAADRSPLIAAVEAMTSDTSYQFDGRFFETGGYTTSDTGYLWDESFVEYFGTPFFVEGSSVPEPVAWATVAWASSPLELDSEELVFLGFMFDGAPGLNDPALFDVEQDADDIASNRYRVISRYGAAIESRFSVTLNNDGFISRVDWGSGPSIEFSNFGGPVNFPVPEIIQDGLDIYCAGTLKLEDCG